MSNLSSLDTNVNVIFPLDPLSKHSFFKAFKNLHSLTLRNPFSTYIPSFQIEDLQSLSHLTELNNFSDSTHNLNSFEKLYGKNYKVLDYFKELKVAKLFSFFTFIDCQTIQETYPHVEFHSGFR